MALKIIGHSKSQHEDERGYMKEKQKSASFMSLLGLMKKEGRQSTL